MKPAEAARLIGWYDYANRILDNDERSRMTSTPYFKIAKRYGVDYGEVLSYSDLYEHDVKQPSCWQRSAALSLPFVVKRAIEAAVQSERARRAAVS